MGMSDKEFIGESAKVGMSDDEFIRGKKTDDFDRRIKAESGGVGRSLLAGVKSAAGNVGAIADMVLGLPGQMVGIGADLGGRAAAIGAGENRRIVALTGQAAKESATKYMTNPVQKLMKVLGYGEDYEQSDVNQAMQTFSTWMEKGGDWVERRTGGAIQKEDVLALADIAMAKGGLSGAEFTQRAMTQKRAPTGAGNRAGYEQAAAAEAEQAGRVQQFLRENPQNVRSPDELVKERQAQFLRDNPQFSSDKTPAQQRFLEENPQFRTTAQQEFLEQNPQQNSPLKEVPKSGDIPIIGESPKQLGGLPPVLESALDKIRNGQGFDMTAAEKIILKDFQSGKNSPLILPEKFRDAKGAADPKLLAGLAAFGMGTVIGNYLSDDFDSEAGIGLSLPFIGMGALKGKEGMFKSAIEAERALKPDLKKEGEVTPANVVETEVPKAEIKTPVQTLQETLPETPAGAGNRRGAIDPQLAKVAGAAGLGALAGVLIQNEGERGTPLMSAILGAVTGAGVMTATGRKVLSEAAKKADYGLGLISTRVQNMSPRVWRRQQKLEADTIKNTYEVVAAAEPMFLGIEKLGEKGKALEVALTRGDYGTVEAELARLNDPAMLEAYNNMRAVISYVGEQTQDLGRMKQVNPNYFPRVVKDLDGLMETLNPGAKKGLEKLLTDAELEMVKKHSRGLDATERTKIIEQYLAANGKGSFLPDYAKSRTIRDIEDGILPFYAKPVEAYHIRMKEAVRDIERAKFFGKNVVNKTEKGKQYIDLDKSIAATVDDAMQSGELKPEDVPELRSILQSRYKGGEQMMSPLLQDAKNMISAGLLGNMVSAIGQYADIGPILAVHEIKPTLSALMEQLAGKSKLTPKDFGLIDHVSQEFISTRPSAKALNWVFSHSMLGKHFSFSGADANMKQLAMNAAAKKGTRWAINNSPELANKYREAYGEDFPQLVEDLKRGADTPLTREFVFHELTRTQPLTKFELPQWALDNPNGRILLSMKTWAMKQADLVRRDVYNEIKAGRKKEGITKALKIGFGLGVGGATIAEIQNFILGRDSELEAGDVIEHAMKTFALNEYTQNDIAKGDVVKAMLSAGVPPYKVFDDIIKGVVFADEPEARNKLIRYIPDIGPVLYNQYFGGKEIYNEREEKKRKQEERKANMTEAEKERRRMLRQLPREERKQMKRQDNLRPIDYQYNGGDIYTDTAGRGILNKRGQVERILERAAESPAQKETYAPGQFEREYTQNALRKIKDPKERRRIEGLIDREINLKQQVRDRRAAKRNFQI